MKKIKAQKRSELKDKLEKKKKLGATLAGQISRIQSNKKYTGHISKISKQ